LGPLDPLEPLLGMFGLGTIAPAKTQIVTPRWLILDLAGHFLANSRNYLWLNLPKFGCVERSADVTYLATPRIKKGTVMVRS
jgi:hypothetical protein